MAELHSVTLLLDVSQPRITTHLSEIPKIKKCRDYFHLSPHFCGKYKAYLPHEYQKTKYAIREFYYAIQELHK